MAFPNPQPPHYEFRTPDDWDEFTGVVGLAYGGYDHGPEHSAAVGALLEPKRSLLACAGGRPCATLAGYSLSMTLPGGPSPVLGIGYVAVSPAHRRRGLMSELVRRTLTDLHERQAEPIAVLNSTEPGIYERFGFGTASQAVSIAVPPEARELTAGGPAAPGLVLEVTSPGDSEEAVASVYQACLSQRPGLLRREGAWLRRAFVDPPGERGGAGRLLCMLALDGDGGGARGYALYRLRSGWTHSYPRYTVSVQELFAVDAGAHAFLWRALLDIDLAGTVTANARPVDDPVLALLKDPRSAAPTLRDQLYARPVDIERALTARRSYGTETDLVLQVRDPVCPWNEGRWRLGAGPSGAACTRTTTAADLALSARELGSVLLGGGSLVQLAHAGRVEELRPGALQAASRAFRHDPAPFCPIVF